MEPAAATPDTSLTLDPIASKTVSENAGAQTVALSGIGGASAITVNVPNPKSPRAQGAVLTVTAASSNSALIPTPRVSYTSPSSGGSLVFTPAPNTSGTALLTVTVADGVNPPMSRTFTVTVNAAGTDPTAPTIALTAPAEGASYTTPASVSLSASVNANGHTISKVQFYADGNLLGEDSAAPYTYNWNTENTGPCTLTARAFYDGTTSSVDSAPVTVSLVSLSGAWTSADIGNITIPGSNREAGEVYTVEGAGNINGTADGLRFMYQSLSGDGSITVAINAVGNTGSEARIGVMIRESLAPGARYAFMGISPDGLFRWQTRSATSGNITSRTARGGSPQTWIRLVRTGSKLEGYRSADGVKWSRMASANLPMAANISIGLAVASGSADTVNTATFSSPTVVP